MTSGAAGRRGAAGGGDGGGHRGGGCFSAVRPPPADRVSWRGARRVGPRVRRGAERRYAKDMCLERAREVRDDSATSTTIERWIRGPTNGPRLEDTGEAARVGKAERAGRPMNAVQLATKRLEHFGILGLHCQLCREITKSGYGVGHGRAIPLPQCAKRLVHLLGCRRRQRSGWRRSFWRCRTVHCGC